MTDHPILFSGPMVRALLEGRKTQARLVLKLKGHKAFTEFGPSDTTGYDWHFRDAGMRWHDLRHSKLLSRLPYAAGDRLWVRECFTCEGQSEGEALYRATVDDDTGYYAEEIAEIRWRPSIHMPRWASRLTLIVTDVRVQQVQEITPAGAIAEGCRPYANSATIDCDTPNPRDDFRDLWDSLNDKRGYGWDANPWVCAVTFSVHRQNIDQMDQQ